MFIRRLMASLFGFLVISLIPYLHIGVVHLKLWVPKKKPVNKSTCTCNCFDTIYKGSYENTGNVGYKHLYFNSTLQTFCIWIVTLAAVLGLYELLKSLRNIYQKGLMRWSMTLLLILDIYPHYYGWWNIFNYFNDDFYKQFRHQLFFSVTEIICTLIILNLCSLDNDLVTWKISGIICISVVHILVGGVDQFFVQLFLGEGADFQKIRNLGFLIPDILHIVIPIYVYRKIYIRKNVSWKDMYARKQLLYLGLSIFLGFVIGKMILS